MNTTNCLPKILFVSPGYKPVPDIAGGAVEHLMTQIIQENERNPSFKFELITIKDKRLKTDEFKHTRIVQIKDFRRTFFLRTFSFVLNTFFSFFKTNLRYSYLGRKAVEKLSADVSFILIENDVNIFKQIANLKPKIPIVFHMHNDFDTFGEMQKNHSSMKFVIEHANEIWTVSSYLKRHLISEFGIEYDSKIHVLENCIDRKRFSPEFVSEEEKYRFQKKYSIEEDDFVILYSGRILKQKGVYELLQVAQILLKKMNYKLIICGDLSAAKKEYRLDLEKIAQTLGNRIVFTGYIPQYEIQTAYAIADIVAVPSQCQEAFCLTALEALCYFKPCVASISGGLADVLDDSCSKMVPLGANFIKEFSVAIQELYENKELYKQMSKNAGARSKLFSDEGKYFEHFCSFSKDIILREVQK